MDKTEEKNICSFCMRDEEEAGPLINGPDGVKICAQCVEFCSMIFETNVEEEEKSENGGLKLSELPRPEEIKASLDEYVIGQDDAKLALAVAVYNHYKRILTLDQAKKSVSKKTNQKTNTFEGLYAVLRDKRKTET